VVCWKNAHKRGGENRCTRSRTLVSLAEEPRYMREEERTMNIFHVAAQRRVLRMRSRRSLIRYEPFTPAAQKAAPVTAEGRRGRAAEWQCCGATRSGRRCTMPVMPRRTGTNPANQMCQRYSRRQGKCRTYDIAMKCLPPVQQGAAGSRSW